MADFPVRESAPSLRGRAGGEALFSLMKKLFILIFSILSLGTQAQTKQEVLDLARKANEYFINKWRDPTAPTIFKVDRPSNLWTRSVYYIGLLALYDQDPQDRYMAYLDRWGDFHDWSPYRKDYTTLDADNMCCGQVYCQRYFIDGKDTKYKGIQKVYNNQIASDRHNTWTWIDAIHMAMPGYAMMTMATGNRKYINFAIKAYTWTRDSCGGTGLYNKEEGLWWRDRNFVAPYKESDGKNCYWSRGNGWVFSALCRTMNYLQPTDKFYTQLLSDYKAMAKALIQIQREDGFWNPSLTSQDFAGPEFTGTAQFFYGLSWGVNRGILNKKVYMPAINKAWNALKSSIHKDGFIGYVQGSGDRPASSQPIDYNREPDFDDYGLGLFLQGAMEYRKMLLK